MAIPRVPKVVSSSASDSGLRLTFDQSATPGFWKKVSPSDNKTKRPGYVGAFKLLKTNLVSYMNFMKGNPPP